MSGFANDFWSSDYAGGLGVIFGKLQQGVQENQQMLTVARMRAEAEELYAQRITDIGPATDRITGGFSRDDGASVRKAYEGVRNEMHQAAISHRKIGSNIRELVVNPFSRWSEQHAARVQASHDDLQSRLKAHDKQAEAVRKLRSQYFNKCRLLEDLEEEDKLAFKSPQDGSTSPKQQQQQQPQQQQRKVPAIKLPESEEPEEPEPLEIGDQTYSPEQVKKILSHMLTNIKLGEVKVPVLGTYTNTSTGADITDYIQKHMDASSVSYAERIGQDMIDLGLLRLVGNVGKTFANSSRMSYRWQPKAFQLAGLPEPRKVAPFGSVNATNAILHSPAVGAVNEYLGGWNPLNNPHPNETPAEKLRRETRESDERYRAGVTRLDTLRCQLEEAIIDHLKFMERCELDRLKAVKSVILDFTGAISNVIPSLQSTVDSMMLFQETIQPSKDLRYILESYRTGAFAPKVPIYENYYNSVDDQTFGIDLEARARSDRKRVPVIVTSILTFLDNHYPELDGDEARRSIWLVDVPLGATHHLRSAINTGKSFSHEVLEKYEVPIVASVLKLYLLELPDSLVSSHLYDIVKTIYSTTAQSASEEARISVIQTTLGQLRLANIATLDAIITHFTRLIELTSADETYIAQLAQTLAPCVLRPKTETSITMTERYNYRLVRDLFEHKDAIFGELKRASSHKYGAAEPARARETSTDESNRRDAQQERARAIASRSRGNSPNPETHGHRRDRSSPPHTRFPVNISAFSGFADAKVRNRASAALDAPTVGSATAARPEEEAAETAGERAVEISSGEFEERSAERSAGTLAQRPTNTTVDRAAERLVEWKPLQFRPLDFAPPARDTPMLGIGSRTNGLSRIDTNGTSMAHNGQKQQQQQEQEQGDSGSSPAADNSNSPMEKSGSGSLGRSSRFPARKAGAVGGLGKAPVSGLARQSAERKRDSGGGWQEAKDEPPRHSGVELVDRPLDFD